MSPSPPLTLEQQRYVANRRAVADGGRVAVDPVAGAEATVMISYRFLGRWQTRLVLPDGYATEACSEPPSVARR